MSVRPPMRLLLASSMFAVTPALRALVREPRGKSVAFIPTASYAERYGGAGRLMAARLRMLGMRVHVLDVARVPARSSVGDGFSDTRQCEQYRRAAHILRSADMFYVCGGNTFYLLQELRESGAADIIRERVMQGVPYVGESAGSVVAAPDISYIGLMDTRDKAPRLESTCGLSLIQGAVVPHVDSHMMGAEAKDILRLYGKYAPSSGACPTCAPVPFIPLRNDQALVADGNRKRVVTHRTLAGALSRSWF